MWSASLFRVVLIQKHILSFMNWIKKENVLANDVINMSSNHLNGGCYSKQCNFSTEFSWPIFFFLTNELANQLTMDIVWLFEVIVISCDMLLTAILLTSFTEHWLGNYMKDDHFNKFNMPSYVHTLKRTKDRFTCTTCCHLKWGSNTVKCHTCHRMSNLLFVFCD